MGSAAFWGSGSAASASVLSFWAVLASPWRFGRFNFGLPLKDPWRAALLVLGFRCMGIPDEGPGLLLRVLLLDEPLLLRLLDAVPLVGLPGGKSLVAVIALDPLRRLGLRRLHWLRDLRHGMETLTLPI